MGIDTTKGSIGLTVTESSSNPYRFVNRIHHSPRMATEDDPLVTSTIEKASVKPIEPVSMETIDVPPPPPMDMRKTVGTGMDDFTKVVNDNLIAVRYGVFAGVTLLTVYGLSQTPLFFRYRTVNEIPSSYFLQRKRFHGRMIGVVVDDTGIESSHGSKDIQILVRHLSPIGQILPKTWFDFFVQFNPRASSVGTTTITSGTGPSRTRSGRAEENRARDLLTIKIAGIQSPPVSRFMYETEEQLKRMARERTLLSFQLLARQVVSSSTHPDVESSSPVHKKRPMMDVIPELAIEDHHHDVDPMKTKKFLLLPNDTRMAEVAICKVTFRPTLFQFFPTDLGQSLISSGNASATSSLLGQEASNGQSSTSTIKDCSERLHDLQSDIKYVDRLIKAEFDAATKSNGMWSIPEVREARRDVIDEVEFQTKANPFQKLWRWIRGG